MGRQYMFNFAFPQRIIKGENGATGITKYSCYALFGQNLDHDFCTSHLHRVTSFPHLFLKSLLLVQYRAIGNVITPLLKQHRHALELPDLFAPSR